MRSTSRRQATVRFHWSSTPTRAPPPILKSYLRSSTELDATQLDFMFNWQARDEFEATCKKQLVKLKTFFKKKPGPEPDWRLLGYLVVYGGRGTGKTRAGYQLAVHLRTKGDLPVRHTFFDAENYRFSDDLLSSGEERPTADRLLALLLSDFQTDDMTEALEMVKAVRQDLPASVVPGVDRSKGLVVLLQVDEFLIQAKGPTSPVTALMRSVRDHVLLTPVVSLLDHRPHLHVCVSLCLSRSGERSWNTG